MRDYWSCTKFANYIRTKFAGRPSLKCGTTTEWNNYDKFMKTHHPIVQWITEDLFDGVQKFLYLPYTTWNNLTYALSARFVRRYHSLPSTLSKWQYHEIDTRMLNCNFQALVDFVEIELPWNRGETLVKVKWYHKTFSRFIDYRDPIEGIAYLDWAAKLVFDESMGCKPDDECYGTLTPQAEKAITTKKLYLWWNNRDLRPDPYLESGWTAHSEKKRDNSGLRFVFDDDDTTDEQRKETRDVLDRLHELEEKYENEDTEMLVELVKIRRGLWS